MRSILTVCIIGAVFNLAAAGAEFRIQKIDRNEHIIYISGQSVEKLRAGTPLYLRTGNGKVTKIIVSYPMMSFAKCTFPKGTDLSFFSKIHEGQSVTTDPKALKRTPIENLAKKTGLFIYPANGHYYFLTKPGTWDEAEREAIEAKGHLVTLNDAAEEIWIRNTLASNERLWIGLTRNGGWSWHWVNDEKFVYTNWHSNEPSNTSGHETCVEMNWGGAVGSSGNSWNDANPTDIKRGVVEIDPGKLGDYQ